MSRLRTAHTEIHTRCGAVVIVGDDDDRMAATARVDPIALTPLGEALALVAGRGTYELRRRASIPELDRRDMWTIPARSAGIHTVLADHVCGGAPLPSRGDPIDLGDRDTRSAGDPDLFTTDKENDHDQPCPF